MYVKLGIQILWLFFLSPLPHQVRDQVMPILIELCDQENFREIVAQSATQFLKYLLLDAPPEALWSHDLGRPLQPMEWTESSVKACLYLYLALLPLNQSMIHE